jgi:hypothetical protein
LPPALPTVEQPVGVGIDRTLPIPSLARITMNARKHVVMMGQWPSEVDHDHDLTFFRHGRFLQESRGFN